MGEPGPAYEAVTAYPGGTSTASRLASSAGRLGYDGLVLRNGPDVEPPGSAATAADRYGLDLVDGLELTPAEPDDASGRLPNLRERVAVLIVAGGTTALNRFVADQRHVDVLAGVCDPGGDRLGSGTAKTARENGVAIELDLGSLATPGGRRVRRLGRLRRLWRVIDAYDVPFVVSARPTSHLALRSPRDLAALGEAVGLGPDAVERGLAGWGTIAARNSRRRDETFIEPGVERADDEADDR